MGRSVFFNPTSGKCTSSHGCWLSVSDFHGFKLEFDPYATDEGARVNAWTFVYMRIDASITEPRYGIESDGRTIRMERRCDWIRQFDGSYQSLDRELDSIYC